MKALVVGAHYDDEVLGAGGLLSTAFEPHALVLCDPWTKENRMDKSHVASVVATRLISEQWEVQYHEAHLRDEQLRLADAVAVIEEVLESVQPDTLVGHWRGDMNQDHRVVAEALRIVGRPNRHPSLRLVLSMEVPSSSEAGDEPIGSDGLYLKFDWSAKRQMLELYQHVLSPDRSIEVCEAAARVRGAVCGSDTAEFFRVLRYVL